MPAFCGSLFSEKHTWWYRIVAMYYYTLRWLNYVYKTQIMMSWIKQSNIRTLLKITLFSTICMVFCCFKQNNPNWVESYFSNCQNSGLWSAKTEKNFSYQLLQKFAISFSQRGVSGTRTSIYLCSMYLDSWTNSLKVGQSEHLEYNYIDLKIAGQFLMYF